MSCSFYQTLTSPSGFNTFCAISIQEIIISVKEMPTPNLSHIAQNMVNLGISFETVVSATELDLEKVKALYEK
jgi:hypothetical protein